MECEICELITTLHLDPQCHSLFTCGRQQAFANYFMELRNRMPRVSRHLRIPPEREVVEMTGTPEIAPEEACA